MKIFFTKHSLVERMIHLGDIYYLLEKPDYVKSSWGNRVLMGKKFEQNILEVVCIKK
jgi:hypothetical protein